MTTANPKEELTIPALEPPRFDNGSSISQQIFDYLSSNVIEGKLLPRTALSENKLCEFFSVSRQPVREALLRLSSAGLVAVYSQRGSFVRPISLTGLKRAQLIRESVEVELLRIAIAHRTPEFVARLRAELSLQKTYQEHLQIEQFYHSDENFHRIISDQTGVSGVFDALKDIKLNLDRVRHLELVTHESIGILIQQHESIFNAIRNGDRRQAERAMRSHLRRVLSELDRIVAAAPEFFEDEP